MNLDNLSYSALIGAGFHLEKIKEYINLQSIQTILKEDSSLDEATKKTLASEVSQFHWHIRAFFWELVSSFDVILQWENYRYELGIQENDVKWDRISEKVGKAKKDQLDWNRQYAILEDAWNSDWFFEIRQYRNFAHRAFISINAEYNGFYGKEKPKLKKIFLTPAREGQQEYIDVVTCLLSYLEKMLELRKEIFGQQTS